MQLTRILSPIVLLACAACGEPTPPPPQPYLLTFFAASDPGVPLEGVTLSLDGEPAGETDEHGILRVQRLGREGQLVQVAAECPDGHRLAEAVPPVALRRFERVGAGAEEEGIRVSLACPPTTRRAAVLVHTEHADLPIMVGGREVARTDASGVASFVLEAPSQTTFRVELDTSDNPRLRPRNPTHVVALADADDVFVFDPNLVEERRRVRRRPRPEPEPEPEAEPEPPRRIERLH